VGETEIDVILV